MSARRALARVRALLGGPRLDRELDDDVRAHLEMAEQDAMARGLSADEARRAARLEFGGIEKMKEEHRDQRRSRPIESLLRDMQHGFALVFRDPGFSAAVIGILALGIGATVAMFTIVDSTLFKPLPFSGGERIVQVWEAPRPGAMNATSPLDFLDWQRLGEDFESLAAENSISVALTGNGEPVRLSGKAVSADYFRVFGASARLGRTFVPTDEQVLVLSHAAWKNDFGGDAAILTRKPLIDGFPHQVIGVLPPGTFDRDRAQFWKPLVFTPEQRTREMHWLTVYGRLREGASLDQARKRMTAIRTALVETLPVYQREGTVEIRPLESMLVGNNLRRTLSVAFGAVALVLLIAVANVANLLLSKGAARNKELAVRVALGAGRFRLVSQLLAESLVLCLLGGVAGMGLASVLLQAGAPVLSATLPYTVDLAIDFRVVGFGTAIALAVSLLAGALPALQISFSSISQPLNRSARGSSGGHARIRRMLVIAEVAISLVLVCGALLLLRSFFNLQRLETGVRIENVITMAVNLPKDSYQTPERAALFYEAVRDRLAAAPGVVQAALTSHLPLQWIGNGEGIEAPGFEKMIRVRFKRVDSEYFSTFGIPVLAGRGVATADRNGAPRIVVINEALAKILGNPVGRRVKVTVPDYLGKPGMTEVEIAGVIRSERVAPPGFPDPAVVYAPLAQIPSHDVKLVVRTRSDPAKAISAIREAVREIDPNLPLGDIFTMEQVRERTLSDATRPAWLIGAFAVVAALLAAVGLFGVLSHAVTQRRREIGIRMALGARPGDVVSNVLRNAAGLVTVGLVLGLLGATALTRVMRGLLYEVTPLDPMALSIACGSMMLVGLLAGFVPAWRAASVDPVTTLRDEG